MPMRSRSKRVKTLRRRNSRKSMRGGGCGVHERRGGGDHEHIRKGGDHCYKRNKRRTKRTRKSRKSRK